MSHSWFVNFDKDFNSEFPLWFICWWSQFGSSVEIFAAPLKDSFQNFTLRFKIDAHGVKFTPLLHFIKKYKVPQILKWQYAKEGDVLTRCWFVKWWDNFPHTQSIINNVTRDFPSPSASPTLRITTPVQKAELADAPASSSAKNADAPASSSAKIVKPPIKPRKKSSPLDEIRKDPNALYALIQMISKEKEAADSEDEWSSATSVRKDPYYPYNQEWFGHDEEDADDLAKD